MLKCILPLTSSIDEFVDWTGAAAATPASLISFLPNGITTCHSTSSSPLVHHHNISFSPKPSPQHKQQSCINLPSPATVLSNGTNTMSSDHYYASTDLIKPNALQGVCGSSVYIVHNMDAKLREDQPIVVPEFHRDRLNFIAKIGVGQYGEVTVLQYPSNRLCCCESNEAILWRAQIHICEAEVMMPEKKSGEVKKQMFAVKALRPLVPDRAR